MAKQRYINTKFWSDNFIREQLNPLDRYLFLYFLTNEKTNICGVYELPLSTISSETGIEKEMLKHMMPRLEGKIYWIDGWVYIKNFVKHQSTTSVTVQKGIEIEMSKIPEKIKEKMTEIDGMDRVSGGIIYSNLNSNYNLNSNPNTKSDTVKAKNKFSQEGSKLLKAFETVDAKNKTYYNNKTQRGACDFLIEEYGKEQVLKIISAIPHTNRFDFFPNITTPYELKEKWVKLGLAIQRKMNEDKELQTLMNL